MIYNQFWKNVLPAMVSFAFSGVYAIVDGIFVGQNTGDVGLAAVNIAYPLTAFIQAMGVGIGMAGAIFLAIYIGQGEQSKEEKYLKTTCTLLLMFSVIVTLFLSVFHVPLLKLFGANNMILEYSTSYMKVIALGSVFQILGTGLIPIIRNYNGAHLAMWAMIAGFTTNVVLDWLFISVLSYGTAGAAVATVIGQAVMMIPCLIFLTIKKKCFHLSTFKIDGILVKDILFTALSPLGLTLTPNIIIIILNKAAIFYGNELAVACYAIISYVVCIVQLLLQGIGDGLQPLLGRYYGAKDIESIQKIRKMAYIFASITAICCMVMLYLLRNIMPHLFGASGDAASMYAEILPYFLLGFVFLAFLRVTTSYFYATQKKQYANVLICGEPILLAILGGFLLPGFWELDGVWLAVPITQFCLAAIGLLFVKRTNTESTQYERSNAIL